MMNTHRDKKMGEGEAPRVGLKFYREDESGDYLCVDWSTNRYYLDNLNEDCFEGRATVANGLSSGINTTSISRRFLECDCTEVKRSEVPKEWLNELVGMANLSDKFIRINRIRSHAGHARFLAQANPTGEYLARVQTEEIPSPYAYSPSVIIYDWQNIPVVCFETSHKVYDVFSIPTNLLRFKSDEEATNWHIKYIKR